MTKFEQELRKLFDHDKLFSNTRFFGNLCYGRLTDQIRVKINFETGIMAGRYDRLRITLINRNEGPIDSAILHFKDIWGMKETSNPNFPGGISPYLWDSYGKVDWYVYSPTKTDYKKLFESARDYLEVFQEPEHQQQQQIGQQMG